MNTWLVCERSELKFAFYFDPLLPDRSVCKNFAEIPKTCLVVVIGKFLRLSMWLVVGERKLFYTKVSLSSFLSFNVLKQFSSLLFFCFILTWKLSLNRLAGLESDFDHDLRLSARVFSLWASTLKYRCFINCYLFDFSPNVFAFKMPGAGNSCDDSIGCVSRLISGSEAQCS